MRDPDAFVDRALLQAVDRRDLRKLWRWVQEAAGQGDAAEEMLQDALQKRAAGMPVSKIIGLRDFWKRSFTVTPDVLDPRPDTETLVEAALAVPFETVLDLGTGSGCILISLLDERPQSTGLGVDISDAALQVARVNGASTPNARFMRSNWFDGVTGRFDLIVSNPPYVTRAEWETLAPEVRAHDPRIALTDEGDGLGAYRHIIAHAPQFLEAGGHVMVEIGFTQGAQVAALFEGAGLTDVKVLQDMTGKDRVITGRGQ